MRVERKRTFRRGEDFLTEVGWFDDATQTMPTAYERPATLEEAQAAGLAPTAPVEVEVPPQAEPDPEQTAKPARNHK